MRKELKQSRGNGFINFLFLVVVIWLVYGAYQQGMFDKLINNHLGHSIKSIEEATCKDLKDGAIGKELSDDTGTVEVIAVRNFQEIRRSKNELVCMGEMASMGNYEILEIIISDWDGDLIIEYKAW
jgi:hypothetical protein